MQAMNHADVAVNELPPLPHMPRWSGEAATLAVPVLGSPFLEQVSTSITLRKNRDGGVRAAKPEAWRENARAVLCRHLQLINSIEQVIGKILALYPPGRFAQLISQLGVDEERQVLVTLRGMRRASRDKGE